MTQSIEYVVKVNATQAQQAVADIEKRFGGVDSVVARVDRRVVGLERDMKDLSAAIARGEGPVEAYKQELAALERQMASIVGEAGRAGHAMQSMGSAATMASGGGNKGMGILQLSQTLDDLQYGVKGVVNNIPGLLQGFGIGAGIAGAAQIAMIGVSQLTDKITAYIKKQQEATQEAIKFRLTLQDMTLASMGDVDDLGKKLERLKAVEAGGETAGLALDLNRKLADEAERRANAEAEIDRLLDVGRSRITKTMPDAIRNLTDAERNRLKAMKATVEQSKVEVEQAVTAYGLKLNILSVEGRIAAAAKARAKAERDAAKAYKAEEAEREERANVSRDMAGMFSQPRIKKAMAESAAEAEMEAEIDAAAARKELQLESLRTDALIQKMRTDLAEEGAKERAKIAQREARDLQAFGMDAAAAIGVFAAQSAMGQEAALENLVGFASQQAGSMIMLEGGKVMAAGIAGMLTAPSPASAAQIAGGAGLVAAGAAVQQIGPAAVAMLSGKAGAMGGTGVTSATRDPGASPRTSSGGSSGGPMIINVSYGAGGPLPEDVAREIERVMSSGNRRRGVA